MANFFEKSTAVTLLPPQNVDLIVMAKNKNVCPLGSFLANLGWGKAI